jgi:hypothetical protein
MNQHHHQDDYNQQQQKSQRAFQNKADHDANEKKKAADHRRAPAMIDTPFRF